MTDHFQTAMLQEGLQGKHISTRSQVCDGPSIAKSVRMSIFYISSCCDAFYDVSQARWIKRTALTDYKQWSACFFAILPFSEISPQSMSGSLPQINGSTLTTFSPTRDTVTNFQFPTLRIKITYAERTKFGSLHTRIEQCQDDGLIAICGRATHHKLSPIRRIHFLRIRAGFQHARDFLPSEGLNLYFLKAWCWDILHRTFDVEFGICPAKEGTRRDPDIPQCFRGQIARVAAPSTWNIFSSHID